MVKLVFYAILIKMLNYYNIPFTFYHDNYPAFCISHAEEMYYPLETFPLQWQKLKFYNVFKDSYTPSIYLDLLIEKLLWNLE